MELKAIIMTRKFRNTIQERVKKMSNDLVRVQR